MKKRIQVDMFAVGLGAALLVQFRTRSGTLVRVLADGGMGPGFLVEGVHDRLSAVVHSFAADEGAVRLDLVVGTHYDADHLKGLVPIADDNSIEIGEVWLPPVKDDTDDIPGHVSDESDYLVAKFFDDSENQVLISYLQRQRARVSELQAEEDRSVAALRERSLGDHLPRYRDNEPMSSIRTSSIEPERNLSLEQYEHFFEAQERDAALRTDKLGGSEPFAKGSGRAHETDEYNSSEPDARDLAHRMIRQLSDARYRSLRVPLAGSWSAQRERVLPAALANIRKSVAAGAITAIYLHKLVQALKRRSVPVRPKCHYISDGKPFHFAWSLSKSRFVRKPPGGDPEIELSLLGPSRSLVEKHREKLPIGVYQYALSQSLEPIRLEGITASNQLSYILTLEMDKQRLLISGDAGCYGFRDKKGNYYLKLLEALRPLHVVQVAHHAGHNYDFYNTLLEARFAEQREQAYLLISHGVRDSKRPSAAFGQFISNIRKHDDDVKLLFTSSPHKAKVEDYDELIHPVVPVGSAADNGDFRLSWRAGSTWTVECHQVAPT